MRNNRRKVKIKQKGDSDEYSKWIEGYTGMNVKDASIGIGSIKSKTADTAQNSGQSQDTAVELEFWKSIKNSNDADMFQAYLDEYPNGKFTPLAKIKIKKLKSSGDD